MKKSFEKLDITEPLKTQWDGALENILGRWFTSPNKCSLKAVPVTILNPGARNTKQFLTSRHSQVKAYQCANSWIFTHVMCVCVCVQLCVCKGS